MKKAKSYIITYRSSEHYEVLGWVSASSREEAIKKAKVDLKEEIMRYGVEDAVIAEWKGLINISLK